MAPDVLGTATFASNSVVGWAATGACAAATAVACLRWLRVAQREHYLPGAAVRFAWRWWSVSPANALLALVGLVGAAVAAAIPAAGFASAVVAVVGPVGLGLKGRSAPLAWTRRLRTLALATAVLVAAVVVLWAAIGRAALGAAALAMLSPMVVDTMCGLLAPVERAAAGRHVARAAERLHRVKPRVVAITGSYGKTSTKELVAHLVGGTTAVLASPQSFNNRAGLARAVNEHLADGTEVFVAEMGTYGKGEIAELCSWIRPEVSVICAIGPVHLERFGTEDRIVEAKSEILAEGAVGVLATDDTRLAAVADRHQAAGHRVRCSTADSAADVCVVAGEDGGFSVWVAGERRGSTGATGAADAAKASNVACAIGVVLALGADLDHALARLASAPVVRHRLEPTQLGTEATALDDTYNANPAGAAAALAALQALAEAGPAGGRRVVVTPGMVELGSRQHEENARFAEAAARVATEVVVVGRTNRHSLLAGIARATPTGASPTQAPSVVVVETREEAVDWVRAHTAAGDVVLYENDLPDHYP